MAKRGRKPAPFQDIGAHTDPDSEKKVCHLMHVLANVALRRGHGTWQLAKELGISYKFLLKLMTGKSPATSLSQKTLKTISEYLGESEIQVYFWAGILSDDSLIRKNPEPAMRLEDTYSTLRRYSNWSIMLPPREEFNKAPEWCKAILIAQFNSDTGINLLEQPEKTEPEKPAKAAAKKAPKVTAGATSGALAPSQGDSLACD
jgi:hypothetical protein